MRRRILNFIVPFLVITLTLSFVAVLPARSPRDTTNSNTQVLQSKEWQWLRGNVTALTETSFNDGTPWKGHKTALENKLDAVENQIENGAPGALNKLENDLMKSVTAWINPTDAAILNGLIYAIIGLLCGANFSIEADPDSLEIEQNKSGTSTIKLKSIRGFNRSVDLSAQLTPYTAKITLYFDPSSVIPTPEGNTSTLTIRVASDTDDREYDITVTGTSGSIQHSVDISLEVLATTTQDFTLTASPNTFTIPRGDSNWSVITVTSLEGFSKRVDLAVTSAPITGVNTNLYPLWVKPSPDSPEISILSIDVATDAFLGSHTITVTGNSTSLKKSANITLQVTEPTAPPPLPTPYFTMVAAPSELTIEQGDSATSAIIVVSHNGFNQSVDVAVTSEPIVGVSLNLEPSQVTPEPPVVPVVTSMLRVRVAKTATTNDYEVTVAGTNSTLTRTVSISLKIIVERKPPEIVSVIRLPEKPNYNESVSVLASVTDDVSGVKDVILNHKHGTASKNVTMTLKEGTYSASIQAFPYNAFVEYRVYASDKAGNSAKSSAYSYVVADPYPPVIGVLYWSPLEPAANEEITINVTVTEPVNASGIDKVVLWYGNKTLDLWQLVQMTLATDGNWTAVLVGQSDTDVEFVVEATDKAGNMAEEEGEFTVAAPVGFPLAWILAAIAAIGAGSGGTAYYVRRRRKKGIIASVPAAPSAEPVQPSPPPSPALARKPVRRRV